MATVRALSNAVEARDAYTGKHAERVAAYGMEIARALGVPMAVRPRSSSASSCTTSARWRFADAILYKPERLTEEERAVMQQHPAIGAEIVRDIEFLGEAAQVVRSHHERWDGAGYPDGLAGEAIPLAARVFAVADVLDALTTDRPYRPAVDARRGTRDDPSEFGEPVRPARRRGVHGDPRRDVHAHRAGDQMTRGVLIVDDDPFIRKLIATTLEDVSEFNLHEASDGLEAVEVARRERPTLVFLDVDMPRLNGIEACRRLRAEPATSGATIVMLTAAHGDGSSARPRRPAPTCS